MSLQPSIGIIGGDMRQVYMADYLLELGYQVCTYALFCDTSCCCGNHANSLADLMEHSDVIIGPIPFSTEYNINLRDPNCPDLSISSFIDNLWPHHIVFGGVIPNEITSFCHNNRIKCYDFMKINRIAILNTIATAEGTIMKAIQNSTINLHASNCLVLGFGKCANTLATKLCGLSANVTIAVRSPDAIASAISYGFQAISLYDLSEHLSEYHYIFNTIPALVLDASKLDYVNPNVTIIDIASAPGGTDFAYAKQKNINAHLCLSLPGKVAPKASAFYLVNEIISLLNERSD